MTDLILNGTSVFYAPQEYAPAGTPENPNPVAPPRPTGTVCGNQALPGDPVSYLIVKEDGTNEWISEEFIEVASEEEAA